MIRICTSILAFCVVAGEVGYYYPEDSPELQFIFGGLFGVFTWILLYFLNRKDLTNNVSKW